jgi:tetratricopeptide (TPR) repeat protein
VARQVEENNHYYYTYNYYNTDNGNGSSNYYDVDENEYSEIKQRLDEKNTTEPAEQTIADKYFDEAVKAFEVNDFDVAALSFAKAAELDKEDIIIPFAYTQAKFAAGDYSEAAGALREALQFIDEDKKTVFFPRGLYRNDQILFDQINALVDMIEKFPFDADLQLLLGYQLIGVGEYDDAVEPLNQARLDMLNSQAAIKLMEILEQAKAKAELQENKI